jgi:hypothetical protein
MTISSTTVKNSYSGDGSTTTFSYTFKIFADSDIQVIIRSTNGTETTKTITTHYTVTGAGNSGGGSVIFTSGNIPTSTQTVVLRRNIPQTQAIDYIANDPFPAESHEEGLDRATMAIQQLQEEVTRSIKLSKTNTMTSTEFTVGASDRANKILAFDTNGELAVTQELGTNRGNWATATTFNGRDIVKDSSNNNIYLCNTTHTSTGTTPISSNADVAKWDLIVDAAAASTSANAAANSASNSSNSANTSANHASNSANHASNSSNFANNSSNSANTSATYLAGVSANANASANSAANSSNFANNSSNSANSSANHSSNSSNFANNSSNHASNSSNFANNSSNSANSASTSASTATTQAGYASSNAATATTQAGYATANATLALGYSSNSSNFANNSSNFANTASNAANAANAARDAALTAADNFDDVYLGAKSSAPTLDNDGDALTAGDLYYNTVSNTLQVYSGSAWQAAAVSTAGFATLTGVETLTNKTLTLPTIDNIKIGYSTTATAAGTTTLTVSSNYKQYFTGSTTQTIVLPVVSTLTLGHTFEIHNNSTGSLTVNSSGSNLVGTIQANTTATCTCILVTGTTAASWDFDVTGFTSALDITRGGTGLNAIGTSLQVLRTNSGATALEFATLSSGTSWQSVKTSGFTAVAGEGYPCNTTSSAFTVTLPASPSVGNYVEIVDYAGTFATNNITLGANSNKINGVVGNKNLTTNREAVTLVYVDATQGWVSTSGANEGTQSLDPTPYSVDFLVIAGGGSGAANRGGGGGAGGYRNSYLTETSGGGGSSEAVLSFTAGVVYTVTVGAGGATNTSATTSVKGSDSSISGTGITTITSLGGGGGIGSSAGGSLVPLADGGSGGGGSAGSNSPNNAGGFGTANQGFNGGTADLNIPNYPAGGGGGAGAVGVNGSGGTTGGNGGAGLSSSITGSSVTRAGGGGGGVYQSGTAGTGGSGGGGAGNTNSNPGTAGTVNTGSGGGGGGQQPPSGNGAAGGSGVVILRMPTANYSGTTTGSPTVTTDGSDKVIVFNSSGTITG